MCEARANLLERPLEWRTRVIPDVQDQKEEMLRGRGMKSLILNTSISSHASTTGTTAVAPCFPVSSWCLTHFLKEPLSHVEITQEVSLHTYFTYFEIVSCLSWLQTCYTVKDDLELLILPPPPPKGCGYRNILPPLSFTL